MKKSLIIQVVGGRMRWVLIGLVVTTIGLMIGFKESKRTAIAQSVLKANMSEVICIGRDDDD